jgi:PHD/YefM family antitoxin component YafN of YafNO toxin-antitoxin module
MPAGEAGARFDEILGWIREGGEAVVVERDGEPEAAVVPYADYQDAIAGRRAEAVEAIRALRARIAARNEDLSDERIDEIGAQFRHDVIQELIARDGVRFEE